MMATGWPRSALAWACLACVVGFSTAAAEPGEVERGLPGPVGRLVACETKMLGCLVAIGAKPGHLGWQPLGIEPAVPFASHELGARITYRGLDALGGVGIAVARQGDAWRIIELVAGGPADRDGRITVSDRVAFLAEGDNGPPNDTSALQLESIRALMRGVVGSTVRLGIAGLDEAIEEIPLVRDERGRDDLAGAAPEDVLERALALRQTLTGLAAPATGPATVHFRTGDAIAAEVLTADEAHVRIRIATDREATIPVGFIRVVELAASVVKPIPKQKLARLLTVPQTRRSVLPTHVLRMISGDYVRGRLLGIDDAVVQFEITGGNTKQLPRRDVSRIIWLATKGDPQPSPRSALEALDGLPVVAVSTHGRRLSLAARGLDGDMLVGEHPALGPVRVPLAGCAELLIGAAIDEHQPAERPYAQWVLSPAASTR